ncbi:MAG: tandem-95 repeat protein, partial [Pseudomonadales bacterium]
DGSITFSQDQLLANTSDVDGDALSAANLSAGANATVTDNGDGTFTVVPDADYNGDIALSFDVTDGAETVATAVDLTVNPVNDVAVVSDAAYSVNEDGSLTITDAALLANASDIEGDALSIDNVSYIGTDGVLTNNGDGTHTFAPNENFNGDVSLSFGVSDGSAVTAAAIDVSVTEINDAPIAGATSYTVDEDGSITISDAQLLANSADVDGSVEVHALFYTGNDGVLDINNNDGLYTFTPNENFNGELNIEVQVIDDEGLISSTTATLDVISINDAPQVESSTAASFVADEDGSLMLSTAELLAAASATDIEGDTLSVSLVSVASGGGTVIDNGDGTFSYFAEADANGLVELTYSVTDGSDTTEAQAVIQLNAVNDAPVVTAPVDIHSETNAVLTLTLEELIGNAADVDGDTLSVANFQATNAIVTDNGDGTYSVIPDTDFIGVANVTYDVSDGLTTATGQLNVTVEATVDDSVDLTAAPGDLLAISIPDGLSSNPDLASITLSNLPEGATVLNGIENIDGTVTIAGNLDQAIQIDLGDSFEGQASISVTGFDENDTAIANGHTDIVVEIDSSYAFSDGAGGSQEALVEYDGNSDSGDWTNYQADNSVDPLADGSTDEGLGGTDTSSGSDSLPDEGYGG